MRLLTTLIILIFSSGLAFSTGQNGDIIFWNNKKYSLFSNPLESYPQFDLIRPKLFGEQPGEWNTGCYRGYIAEWEILNNQLYLVNIFSCNDQNLKANLNLLFPDIISNGKINAYWVNQTLLVPDGKCIYYGNIGYSYIYETEYELTIKNGELIENKKYDNSSHISIFTQKPDSLMNFIYKTIQWSNIPDTLKNPVRVNLLLTTSDVNKPEIKILKGSGIKVYDDEALRVAYQLPDWDFYIQRGKVFKIYWFLPVIFSNENKIKYTH
jgi:hypothetical protein